MKIGLNLWAYPDTTLLEEMFHQSSVAGFDGVEINLDERGYLTPETSKANVESIARLARRHNLEISSVCSGLFWKYSLTSDTESERKTGLAIVKRMVEVASWLGVARILVVPGAVENPFATPVPAPVPYDVAYARALAALKEVSVWATQHKVHVGIENVWNKFLLSPLEMRHLIDEVASPFVGCYLDVGNVLALGYPEQWIRILGEHIRQIHVKDFKKTAMHSGTFVGLLEGDVDWIRIREALKAIKYRGYVVAELMPLRIYPEQRILQTARVMSALFHER
jgi:hexulose-6-phosphate isomerase